MDLVGIVFIIGYLLQFVETWNTTNGKWKLQDVWFRLLPCMHYGKNKLEHTRFTL